MHDADALAQWKNRTFDQRTVHDEQGQGLPHYVIEDDYPLADSFPQAPQQEQPGDIVRLLLLTGTVP